MREEVTEYEVEKVERTEERVYCDTCGGDCTDDFKVEPRELCPDCQTDDGWTFSKYREAFQDWEDDKAMGTPEMFVLTTGFWPVFFVAALLDWMDGEEYPVLYLGGALGMALWLGILSLAVVAYAVTVAP